MTKLAVISLVVLVGVAALGSPRPESQRVARQHWDAATSLYNLGEFARAAEEYRESYKAVPDHTILYDIAQCYRLGNDLPQALFFYRSYLRNAPNAPNRVEVEDRIRRLDAQIATQKQVTATPPNGVHLANGAVQPEPKLPPAIPPPLSPLPVAAATVAAPVPRAATPAYKRWWVWTAVGAVAVSAVAIGLGVGLTSSARAPQSDLGNSKVF
jgi:hypothetical protein